MVLNLKISCYDNTMKIYTKRYIFSIDIHYVYYTSSHFENMHVSRFPVQFVRRVFGCPLRTYIYTRLPEFTYCCSPLVTDSRYSNITLPQTPADALCKPSNLRKSCFHTCFLRFSNFVVTILCYS